MSIANAFNTAFGDPGSLEHRQQTIPQDGRTVWLGYFGNLEGRSVPHYLGGRVRQLADEAPAPRSGLLVISPVWVAGPYGHEQYAFLRERTPDAIIGHNMLVYDLDRLAN